MNIIDIYKILDNSYELHISRLLILINIVNKENTNKSINGLTKLVKLDFFLRYPVCLDKALSFINKKIDIGILDYERNNIESKMIRYKYGPWDHIYYKILNLMVAKKYIKIEYIRNTYKIYITEDGINACKLLKDTNNFNDYIIRSTVLSKHFNWTASALTKFIYDNFEEVASLKLGEIIEYEY